MQGNTHIRAATESDVPVILGFIRELADFEHLSHEVVATETLLRKNLFGERKHAEVLIAEFENRPVGFALYFFSFSTFLGKPGIYLEDLYVQPQFRSKGIGFRLLRTLAKICKERDYGRLEWSVLDWNERALSFYHRLGAKPMSDWTVQRMTAPTFSALASREEP